MIDLKSFPILYEEKTRDLVEEFIFDHFENCDDGMICHEMESEYVQSDVFNFGSDFFEGSRLYVTCGMGARSQNSLRPRYDHIELMMFGSKNLKNDIDIMDQLVSLSKYPFRNSSWGDSSWIGPFHTIFTSKEIKEKFGYSHLWLLPEVFGELEVTDSSGTYTIKFLPMVPLYEAERNVLARMDESSEELQNKLLEAIEEDISMFYIDNPRQNLATQVEPTQIDIKDRKAFANDLKDMLQEFIDMGDIDYEDDEDDINDD